MIVPVDKLGRRYRQSREAGGLKVVGQLERKAVEGKIDLTIVVFVQQVWLTSDGRENSRR
ncbi:MAG: hypothetical protein ABIK86_03130 [candidate division WOR-3 bacterium]